MPQPRDRMLDLWAAGVSAPQISAQIGTYLTDLEVRKLVSRARAQGDPRAVLRTARGQQNAGWAAVREAMAKGRRHYHRLRVAQRFPSSTDELQAVAAASSVPVTQCPPGVHAGWRPSWA